MITCGELSNVGDSRITGIFFIRILYRGKKGEKILVSCTCSELKEMNEEDAGRREGVSLNFICS